MSQIDEEFRSFWKKYNYIYKKQKELYILSEEYDKDLCSFLQPIKEQKDSLDHIVRVYSNFYKLGDNSEYDEDYIKKNLDKAIGHIYRAYYDAADFLSVVLREKISANLNNFTYTEIVSVWKDYETYRKKLIDFPDKMADLRLDKGVDKDTFEISKKISLYESAINELLDIYKIFVVEILPLLCIKYKK